MQYQGYIHTWRFQSNSILQYSLSVTPYMEHLLSRLIRLSSTRPPYFAQSKSRTPLLHVSSNKPAQIDSTYLENAVQIYAEVTLTSLMLKSSLSNRVHELMLT